MTPGSPERQRLQWRQWGASLVIAAYLGTLVLYLGRQVLGDAATGPGAYFFTWDMFPYYYTWSSRRVALGKTAAGKFVELQPSSRQRFRSGAGGALTRADLDRSGQGLRLFADHAVSRAAAQGSSDPVVRVWLLEEYWPEKFNLRDELYEEFWGQAKPDRTYWRTLAEYDVAAASRSPERKSPPGPAGAAP